MAREFNRTDRVAEQLQREVAQIIQMEVKDPRLGMVTVSGVDISRDLYYATAYVTFLGIEETEKNLKQALDVLNQASGFIRSLIGKRMKMRVIPQLKFEYDKSIAHGSELSALIQKARNKDSDNESDEDS
ncbi:30S ribosome-binding factor RbfA [Aliikangiella marina]|uniref:Ribosome-binding factor A n=1 Tax=Aliikangiella marina TaxID=1712262 RepID=A0A545TC91_9GAMM|nr:30S ribosome-binding factor RbfA [Aliikangiella marina]TQV74837.1 30S ribosome-binding factor RbfA [Aliikangiella marina]